MTLLFTQDKSLGTLRRQHQCKSHGRDRRHRRIGGRLQHNRHQGRFLCIIFCLLQRSQRPECRRAQRQHGDRRHRRLQLRARRQPQYSRLQLRARRQHQDRRLQLRRQHGERRWAQQQQRHRQRQWEQTEHLLQSLRSVILMQKKQQSQMCSE